MAERLAQRGLGADVGLDNEALIGLYRTMALARALDERMWTLNRAGRVAFVISGQGHEGAQVGIVASLRRGHDWMVPYYRSIAAVLSFGMTARELMLGQYARAADPASGGRQMPSHFGHAGRNIFTTSSPVATQVLHAAGIALAAQLRGTDQVAMTFLGEGASNQGDVHEALNFAGIHRLPLVVVIENNGYAISVPAALECAVEDLAIRAAGYNLPGVTVDGAEVIDCYRAGSEAAKRARRGDGPTLIEAKVARLTAHSSDDQQTKYRSAEELERERADDPLPRFRRQLLEAGALGAQAEKGIAEEVRAAVDDATEFAEAAPDPTIESAPWHVYADDAPEAGGDARMGA